MLEEIQKIQEKRIDFLDGLRGVAILIVVLFHAYSRWPSIVPYGNKFGEILIFKYGFLGVELFFLISGFVILKSLEKNKTYFNFIYKRWIRLFPAMFIATIILYFTSPFLSERPAGNPQLNSVIPGLVFLEPSWIKIITGIKINILEGAFWSLFVEVKFYFIFGFLYFYFGESKAILSLTILYFISIFLKFNHISYLSEISNLLSFNYFGWFACGCLVFLFFSTRQAKYLYYALGLCIILSVIYGNKDLFILFFCLGILTIFILPLFFEKLKVLLSSKFFLFLGFISYPLYLIHQNAMIALIVKLNKTFGTIPDLLLPIFPIMIICLIAFIIATKLEPLIRKLILQLINFCQQKFAKIGVIRID